MAAHALTALRLLLVIPFAVLMAGSGAAGAAWAALVLAAAVATDLLDGMAARRHGTASPAGRLFDHLTDVLFVVGGLAAGALRGAFPPVLPLLVALAFAQYVIDSYWLDRAGRLRPSRLGRLNGILYFAPLGGDILVRLGAQALAPLVTALAWLLVASTLGSMGERLAAVVRARGAGASPGGGTGGRWPR